MSARAIRLQWQRVESYVPGLYYHEAHVALGAMAIVYEPDEVSPFVRWRLTEQDSATAVASVDDGKRAAESCAERILSAALALLVADPGPPVAAGDRRGAVAT